MDFQLTDEQVMLADSTERLFAERRNPARWGDLPDGAQARARWVQLGELGLLGLALPDAGEGAGTVTDFALLMETAGAAMAPEPVVGTGLAARDLLAECREGQASSLLDDVIRGDRIVALALGTWAGAFVAARGGDGWTLRGEDPIVIGLGFADLVMTVAAMEGEDGLGLFLVDPQAAGVECGGTRLIDGSWGGRLSLSGTTATLLCICDRGRIVEILTRVRLMLCAELLGVMSSAVRLTGEYLKTRVQFDRPLADQQGLRHQLADMTVMTELARAYLHVGLETVENDAADAPEQVAALRRAVGELAISVGERAVQLHGGMGMTEEHAIGHHLKRALVLSAAFPDGWS